MSTPAFPMLPPEVQAQLDQLMQAHATRPRRDRFDASVIARIPDEALEQALLDHLFDRLARCGHDHDEAFAALSPEFRVFHCTWEVEAQVMNGGFNQYFWNPSSRRADDVPAALRAIGDEVAAGLMEEAQHIALAELPAQARWLQAGTLEAFSESYQHTALNALDEPFCRRAAGFPALRLAYVRSRPDAFATP